MSHSKIDPSQVLPWSEALSKEEPYEYPFRAIYKQDNKTVIYIASLHSSTANSPTFKRIEDTLKNYKIDLMILEGFGYSLGVSPANMTKWASQQGKNGSYVGFETAFSIIQANQKQIPFQGGEPDELAILDRVQNLGYSKDDFAFYQFLQQVFEYQEVDPNYSNKVEELFQVFIKGKEKIIVGPQYTLDSFEKWYLAKTGNKFSPSKIKPEDLAPYENGNVFTQKISSAVCKVRDQFVLTKIDESLKTYDTLLVIFGGSHWSTQKKALENALGGPRFEN